jgi:molybdopterin molybdotransferase
MALLAVEAALERMLEGIEPTGAERVSLGEALGRTLAEPLAARRDQPPFAASAMDGYAVRAADTRGAPVELSLIGEARAGESFSGRVGAGETVRIFTGAPVPAGADAVLIQENAEPLGDGRVRVLQSLAEGAFVRPRGLDFAKGEVLFEAGRVLDSRAVGLAAAMNHAEVTVRKPPEVAVLATGDELVTVGSEPRADQIVSSNGPSLAALVREAGGAPRDLGIAADDAAAIARRLEEAREASLVLTIGGASVGEHDLVHRALERLAIPLEFWKIAMRPGKPMLFARRGRQAIVGLPGNPVSAQVCARVFVVPLIDRLLGRQARSRVETAQLGKPLPANDQRQDYLRARLERGAGGVLVAHPFPRQDSSMQRVLAESDCLIVRPPHAPPAEAGAEVPILPLSHS